MNDQREDYYRKIVDKMSFCNNSPSCMTTFNEADIGRILDDMEAHIKHNMRTLGLKEVAKENAEMICIGFCVCGDGNDHDIYGVCCFDARAKSKEYVIRYCDNGEVNNVDVMKIPHVTFFCK